MKKTNSVLIAFVAAIALTACSSGTTVSPTPISFTGVYIGTFKNTPDTQSGTLTLNIAESADGTQVTGNMIFDSEREACLVNAVISSSSISGFSISITANQSESNSSGSTVTTGSINMQMTQGNNGNSLDGTYVTSGNQCSNSTGSGVVNLVRR